MLGLESDVEIDDPDLSSEYHETALILAAAGGHLDCVKELLSRGASIEAMDSSRRTALICACLNGRVDCVEELLRRGAEINKQDGFGATALNRAAANGHLECIKLLMEQSCIRLVIERSCKIDFANQNGMTSLASAALGSHYDCFVFLLGSGAYVPPVGGGLRRQLDDLLGLPKNSKLRVALQEHESRIPTSLETSISPPRTPRRTANPNAIIPVVPTPELLNLPLNHEGSTSQQGDEDIPIINPNLADPMVQQVREFANEKAKLVKKVEERDTEILKLDKEVKKLKAQVETANQETSKAKASNATIEAAAAEYSRLYVTLSDEVKKLETAAAAAEEAETNLLEILDAKDTQIKNLDEQREVAEKKISDAQAAEARLRATMECFQLLLKNMASAQVRSIDGRSRTVNDLVEYAPSLAEYLSHFVNESNQLKLVSSTGESSDDATESAVDANESNDVASESNDAASESSESSVDEDIRQLDEQIMELGGRVTKVEKEASELEAAAKAAANARITQLKAQMKELEATMAVQDEEEQEDTPEAQAALEAAATNVEAELRTTLDERDTVILQLNARIRELEAARIVRTRYRS